MKFSKSLLNNKDACHCIFQKALEKTKLFLEEIFSLNFESDKRILSIKEDEQEFFYKVVFLYNNRKIIAILNLENSEDMLVEVLKIHEFIEEYLSIENKYNDFSTAVLAAMDLLEQKYNINFTPLDPEECDPNILSIRKNEEEKFWEVVFLIEDQESKLTALLQYEKSCIQILQHRQHVIYIE